MTCGDTVNRLRGERGDAEPFYWALYVPQAVVLTFANAYARASVLDNLCGFSFAATGADRITFNGTTLLVPY